MCEGVLLVLLSCQDLIRPHRRAVVKHPLRSFALLLPYLAAFRLSGQHRSPSSLPRPRSSATFDSARAALLLVVQECARRRSGYRLPWTAVA